MPSSDVFNLSSCPVSENESEAGVLQLTLPKSGKLSCYHNWFGTWGRMGTGVLLRWQHLFQRAPASFRQERKVSLSFVLFYTDSDNSIFQGNWVDWATVETVSLVTSESDSVEHFVHFLHWYLGQGAELVEHAWYRIQLVCSPLESERKLGVSGPGREHCIKNWAFPLFGRHTYGIHTDWIRLFSPEISITVSPNTKGTDRFF